MTTQYNKHSTILAKMALEILNGNKDVLDINGIKEIIAIYLMIPYMSNRVLDPPDNSSFIPKITERFSEDISFSDLRDTIAHSFVTVEEDDGDPNSRRGKMLCFDDRIICDKKSHSKKGLHGDAVFIPIEYTHNRLIQVAKKLVDKKHNTKQCTAKIAK